MENVTTNSTPWWEMEVMSLEIALDVLHFLIFITATTGNGFVICVYFWSSGLKDTTMKVMVNLAFTDFTTGCMTGIYFIYSVTETWNSSYISCMMSEQALTAMMLVSEAVLTIATLDRYISICHRAHYQKIMTRRNLNAMMFLAWFSSIILALMPMFGFNDWDIIQICFYSIMLHDWLYITYSSIMVGLMILSIVFYMQIIVKAHRFHKRLHPAQTQGINTRSTTIRRRTQSLRNGKIMGIVIIVFILCWFPFQVDQYNFGTRFLDSFSTYTARFTFNLGLLNSVVNPFLFSLQKREFKNEVFKLFKCLKCRVCKEKKSKSNNGIPKIKMQEKQKNNVKSSNIGMPFRGGKVHPRQTQLILNDGNELQNQDSAIGQSIASASNCNKRIFVVEAEMHGTPHSRDRAPEQVKTIESHNAPEPHQRKNQSLHFIEIENHNSPQ